MPKCYQLIGVPGSGKSTWFNSNQLRFMHCVYISTDKFVDAYAHEVGKTYTEVFDIIMPRAVDLMSAEVVKARDEGLDIVWDQTSTSVTSRMRKFNMLPQYKHIAVVLPTPAIEILKQRLKQRELVHGKFIPWKIVQGMIDNWEDPILAEGFDEIWNINT